jgi:hypothetical protein
VISVARGFCKNLPGYLAIVIAALFALSACAEHQIPSLKDSLPIVDVQIGTPTYFAAGGDSWDPTWSQDDALYSAVNDGAGFGTLKRNIGFNRISGSDPRTLAGQLQSTMDDYGEMNAPVATDGRNWRAEEAYQSMERSTCQSEWIGMSILVTEEGRRGSTRAS